MRVDIRTILNTKDTKGLKLSILICTVLIMLSIYYLEQRAEIQATSHIIYQQKAEFRVIKLMNGVHTFSNVCIEELITPKLENRLRLIFNETKKIVIYGNNNQDDGARITLRVAGSPNTLWNHWEIHFIRKFPPSERLRYFRDTAFFVEPTCPGNFHHFFIDEFIPLYSVVALSNRLHPGARNQILYRTPQVGLDDDRCYSRRTYEGFLRTLYIDDFHDVFYNLPNNTCFRQAVFGSTPLLFRQRDVIDHVLSYYNLTKHSHRNANNLYVTILGRRDRRIINAEEVLSFAKEVGFQNLRIVDFSGKSIRSQLETMSTSNVFMGIQGAGLQWSIFMPESSYLIELAWPQKHWGFYYASFVPRFGITWRAVGVQNVRLNWTSYANNVRRGVPVSEVEKPMLIKTHPRDATDNIWKWSDVIVQRSDIFETLQIAHNGLKSLQ